MLLLSQTWSCYSNGPHFSLTCYSFCVSYSEVLNYERCTARYQGTKYPCISEFSLYEPANSMHQKEAYNVGHNSRALDGSNKFRGISIKYSVIPEISSSFTVPHLENVPTKDLIRLTEIKWKVLPSSRRLLKLSLSNL